MIDFDGFGRLRAVDYIAEDELESRDSWEFLGCVWLRWGSGFTDFLATYDEPDVTRCISIDLDDLPAATAARLLRDIDIPLRKGVRHPPPPRLRRGARPLFTPDPGLAYLVIHPPLPPGAISAAESPGCLP